MKLTEILKELNGKNSCAVAITKDGKGSIILDHVPILIDEIDDILKKISSEDFKVYEFNEFDGGILEIIIEEVKK